MNNLQWALFSSLKDKLLDNAYHLIDYSLSFNERTKEKGASNADVGVRF